MTLPTRVLRPGPQAGAAAPLDDIEELLHRRSDLSTFLVHFTRDGEASARDNLLSMLRERRIYARSVYGMMKNQAAANPALAEKQRCVCLTETPLEHAWMMCRPIAGRSHQFSHYGLAFPKVWARREGANPVWYVDMTPGHDWLTNELNDLIAIAEAGEARVLQSSAVARRVPVEEAQITRLAPFIEQMGTWELNRKEFWWEREWRKVGSLAFSLSDVVAAFAPAADHAAFAADLRRAEAGRIDAEESPPLLDPSWGLERMISALRGLPTGDVGPLP